jgi:hypothetical protein
LHHHQIRSAPCRRSPRFCHHHKRTAWRIATKR